MGCIGQVFKDAGAGRATATTAEAVEQEGEPAAAAVTAMGAGVEEIRREVTEQERKWRGESLAEMSGSAFHKAVMQGDPNKVEEMLAFGQAKVDELDRAGRSGLGYAAVLGDQAMAALLLKQGAEVNLIDDNPGLEGWEYPGCGEKGFGSLHYAVISGDVGMVEFLLDKGAKVGMTGKERGISPLWLAVERDEAEIVKALVKGGADWQQCDRYGGGTIVDEAAKGDVEGMQRVLDWGADINGVNGKGQTPLMTTCQWGNDDMVVYLIKQGANLGATDAKGDNVLHKAVGGSYAVETAGVGAQVLKLWGSKYVAVASGLLTLMILVGSEIIPKTLGAVHWKRLASFASYWPSSWYWPSLWCTASVLG